MQEYDTLTLSHLQSIELMMYKDFQHVCEENNLLYFGHAGTAIGALRHKGFIPWDDDIDVHLPREDFEKCLKVFQQDYSDKYLVMNADTNINYPLTTTRIMLRETKFREESLQGIDCELGIFLDVYAMDSVANDKKLYKKQAWDAWFWSHVLILLSVPDPVITARGFKGSCTKLAAKIGYLVFKCCGVSKESAYAKTKEAMLRYSGIKTKRIAYLCDTNRFNFTFAWNDILPLRKIAFEDTFIFLPNKIEDQLNHLFGDFMQLPPENQRKNHYPAELDFGPY